MKKALFLQFTNPAGYPPLEHASRLMVERGWEALFLGLAVPEVQHLVMPPLSGRTSRLMPYFGRGAFVRLSYLLYLLWTALVCLTWRPTVIYASDFHSAGAALLGRTLTGARLVYHEHDSPAGPAGRRGWAWSAYLRLSREADLCILPQAQRLSLFKTVTGREGPSLCVWNCPSVQDVGPSRESSSNQAMRFYFHGSINAARLPLTLLDALARHPTASLTIAGYEPNAGRYLEQMFARAAELSIADRVHYAGALSRFELPPLARQADVGLAFMPPNGDVNMVHMVGASNKPFEYLSQGLMLLVSDVTEWKDLFVSPGFALACTPGDVDSLSDAMNWCVSNPDKVRSMGEAGRRKIMADWNYESGFAPVLDWLDSA